MKKIREKLILKEIKKYTKKYFEEENLMSRIMIGVKLNEIKSESAKLVWNNKISKDFYKAYFLDKRTDATISWWEVKKDFILN